MFTIAKIKCENPQHKTAIVGISLNGNGRYTKEQVAVLIKQANKFLQYTIVLHGDDEQCSVWKEEHKESLALAKSGTKFLYWSFFQKEQAYQGTLDGFVAFYKNVDNKDFRIGIDRTADLYLERQQKGAYDHEKAVFFILEEMAFLTKFAVDNKADYFVYKGEELSAFHVTRKYFFSGADQNLFRWAELFFVNPKKHNPRFFAPMPVVNELSNGQDLRALTVEVQRMSKQINSVLFNASIIVLQGETQKLPDVMNQLSQRYGMLVQLLTQISKQQQTFFTQQSFLPMDQSQVSSHKNQKEDYMFDSDEEHFGPGFGDG